MQVVSLRCASRVVAIATSAAALEVRNRAVKELLGLELLQALKLEIQADLQWTEWMIWPCLVDDGRPLMWILTC